MMSRATISEIVVVIPARDEQDLIRACLESVVNSATRVSVPVHIIVAADGCLDNTVPIARTFPGVRVLELDSSNVGAARAAGVRVALTAASAEPESVWIANTDADSRVPAHWLVHQLLQARQGVDVVVGTVRPDFADLTESQIRQWKDTHPVGVANGHVHGANLGIRASAYLRAGGFESAPEHEDVDLVGRLGSFRASADCEVVTSGRQYGRTPGGYARFLRENLRTDSVDYSRHNTQLVRRGQAITTDGTNR